MSLLYVYQNNQVQKELLESSQLEKQVINQT